MRVRSLVLPSIVGACLACVSACTDSPAADGCPEKPPTAGDACSKEMLYCEYGDARHPLCDPVFMCFSGEWNGPDELVLNGATPCPADQPNPDECPATFDAVERGGDCTGGTLCVYDDGECACTQYDPEPTGPTWHCDDPTPDSSPGCTPRPRWGTPCEPDQSCQFGAPFCFYGQTCSDDGLWTYTPCTGA